MKKLVCLSVLAGCLAACATGTQTANTQPQTITLDQALQKSAETRQKLEEAKQAYQNARENSQAAKNGSDSSSAVETVKAQIKQKVDESKAQVDAEVNAWKETLK